MICSNIAFANIQIKTANKEDASSIARLHYNTWHNAFDKMLPDIYIKKMSLKFLLNYWDNFFDKQTSTDFILIAKENDNVIGFSAAGDIVEHSKNTHGYTAELFKLYVDHNAQGIGIGRNLMIQTICELKKHGHTKVIVRVFYKNTDAPKFYQKMGYKFIGQEDSIDYHGSLLFNVYGLEIL